MFKVVLVGESGVGKTSLMEKFVNKRFTGNYKSTIGADFLTQELTVDGKQATLQIWDTAGAERWNSLGRVFYRGADCCMLVFDVTHQKTLYDLEHWKDEFIQHAHFDGISDSSLFYVIANRTDLTTQRTVSREEAEKWCKEHGNIPLLETSAKTGLNVDKAFLDLVKQLLKREKDTPTCAVSSHSASEDDGQCACT